MILAPNTRLSAVSRVSAFAIGDDVDVHPAGTGENFRVQGEIAGFVDVAGVEHIACRCSTDWPPDDERRSVSAYWAHPTVRATLRPH